MPDPSPHLIGKLFFTGGLFFPFFPRFGGPLARRNPFEQAHLNGCTHSEGVLRECQRAAPLQNRTLASSFGDTCAGDLTFDIESRPLIRSAAPAQSRRVFLSRSCSQGATKTVAGPSLLRDPWGVTRCRPSNNSSGILVLLRSSKKSAPATSSPPLGLHPAPSPRATAARRTGALGRRSPRG